MTKRRQFTPELKARVVLDVLSGVQSQAEACRRHGLNPNLLALWKSTFLERAHMVFESDTTRSAEQAARIAELEQVLGRMALENEPLKKSSPSEYEDFADARRQLGRFLDDVYNTKRIHSSLGYLIPAEFEQQWMEMQYKS